MTTIRMEKGIWPPFDGIEYRGHNNITVIDQWKNTNGGGGVKWDLCQPWCPTFERLMNFAD